MPFLEMPVSAMGGGGGAGWGGKGVRSGVRGGAGEARCGKRTPPETRRRGPPRATTRALPPRPLEFTHGARGFGGRGASGRTLRARAGAGRGGKRTGVHLLEHLVDVRVEGLLALAVRLLLAAGGRGLRGLRRLLGGGSLGHLEGLRGVKGVCARGQPPPPTAAVWRPKSGGARLTGLRRALAARVAMRRCAPRGCSSIAASMHVFTRGGSAEAEMGGGVAAYPRIHGRKRPRRLAPRGTSFLNF